MRKLLPLIPILLLLGAGAQAQCDAAFTAGQNRATVFLTAADNSPMMQHKWLFGDGVEKNWGNPVSHTYNLPGTYQVTHIVQDSLGTCTDTMVQSVTIEASVTCKAYFTADSLERDVYRFTSTSSGNGSNIVAYYWTINGFYASSASSFVERLAPGRNMICVTIMTAIGCESYACDSVVVDTPSNCNASAAFLATVSGPTAYFSGLDSTNLFHSWDFGDGTSGSGQNVSHNYAVSGYFQVTHQVIDSVNQCMVTEKQVVVVNAPATCQASYNYGKDSIDQGKYYFYSTSTSTAGDIVSYQWRLNGVFVSSASHFRSTLKNGHNAIQLAIETSQGCRSSVLDSIWVDSLIVPDSVAFVASFPNPSRESFVHIGLNMEQEAQVKITIYNSYGVAVYKQEKRYGEGSNRISLPIEKLQQGLYFVDIRYGNARKRSRFQKL